MIILKEPVAKTGLKLTPKQLIPGALALSIALTISALPASAQTSASVSVNASSTTNTVPPEGYGVDTAVYDGSLTSSGVAPALKASGINAIRYPGGSYADIFNFISGTDQSLNGGYFAPGDTFNNFMNDVVLPEGGKAFITVNYGSNVGATGPAPTSEAASWVQYANVTNHYGIVYWEIGNEVYGNGYYSGSLNWEEDLHVTSTNEANRQGNPALSPTAYGANAAAFIKAMKAVDPTIKCGVFVNTASYYPNWDQDVLQAVSSGLSGSGYSLDFVILHYYPGGSNAQVLSAQATIASQVSQVRSDVSRYYTGPNGGSMQIAVTESGAPSDGGLFQYLFAVDDYLSWLEIGSVANVEYQELHNGYLDGNNVGLGPYYGAQFASTIARPGDNFVSTSSNNSLLRAHAVNRTDGKVGIVLINDDPNNSTNVNVNVSGATLTTSGTQYKFGSANFPNGTEYASSGISSSSISGVGNTFTINVPAYSSVAVVIPTGGGGGGGGNLIANGTYTITNKNSGLAVEDPGASTTQGTDMDQWTVNGGNNQKWKLTNLGNNYVSLINVASGYAMDVNSASKTAGALVDQWPYSGGTNQIWKVVSMGSGYYELISENSNMALDVRGYSTANGGAIDQWTTTGGANQLFTIR
ncbi:MAG TPA: RICIN domain-containing protein [Acidisarcina sp.]